MVYPGAYWDPGVNAGYHGGHNRMELAVAHYTVGRDSSGIGRQGYFTWLVARDGMIRQFAEADAVTWHACEWNPRGPGIEVEYLPGMDDVMFTDAARTACSGLVHWLNTDWGIPLTYYDGLRLAVGTPYSGFISHRALHEVQCDEHYDSWPQADWDLMIQGAVDVGLDLTKPEDLTVWREAYYNQEGAWPTTENGQPVTIDYHKPVIMAKLDQILAGLAAGTGGGGTGFTEAQIKQWIAEGVRAELDKTKLAH